MKSLLPISAVLAFANNSLKVIEPRQEKLDAEARDTREHDPYREREQEELTEARQALDVMLEQAKMAERYGGLTIEVDMGDMTRIASLVEDVERAGET